MRGSVLVVAVLVAGLVAQPAQAAITFSPPTSYGAGSGAGALVTGDFNLDSDADIAVANSLSDDVSILLGSAGGTFTGPVNFAVGGSPQDIAVGDFNADFLPDLVTANYSGDSVAILLGNGLGGFSPPMNITLLSAGDAPFDVAVSDFNGDSDPDLAVARYISGIWILLGGAGGTFGEPTEPETGLNPEYAGSSWIHAADLNGDSDPDLVTSAGLRDEASVLLGGPDASFYAPAFIRTGARSVFSLIGSFDRDRKPDLAVSASGGVVVSLGRGNGSFGRPVRSIASFRGSFAAGSFDRDSRTDLVITGVDSDHEPGISILLGRDRGRFVEATSFFAGPAGVGSVATADFDGNSRDDLATSSYNTGSVSIWLR